MPKKVRVNVRTLANTKAARREVRNGRDVMIVPSATLPDNVVMNDIMYPSDEIESAYKTLERTPAPAGHPLINGNFISARDPEGINIGWIGAWNENCRREGGRVLLDKIIDIERANQTEKGKAVLEAVEKGEPVHTSTGLLLDLEAANGNVDYKYIARNMMFDHDAILIGEEGAATPQQGVGMMVNAKGEQEQIEVINSTLEATENEFDWAVDMAARAAQEMERAKERKPLIDRIKTAIKEAVSGSEGRETSANEKGEAEMADDKQLDALSAKVNALGEQMKPLENIGETIANAIQDAVKPIKDHVDQIAANQKAEEDAKRANAVNALVKTGHWSEDDLKEMPMAALNKLVEKSKPGKAAALNGAFGGGGDDDEFQDVDLNSAINDADKNKEMH